MTKRIHWAVLFALVAACTHAQDRARLPEPQNPSELATFLESGNPMREAGAVETAVRILTGKQQVPTLTSAAVVQQLVTVAATSAVRSARTGAMAAILTAGKRSQPDRYNEALAEIFRRSSDVGVKGLAMSFMFELASPAAALNFLKPIAAHFDPKFPILQSGGIVGIAKLNTAASAAFLRQLDKSGTLTDEWAIQRMRTAAANGYRWPEEPKRGGSPGVLENARFDRVGRSQ